MSLQLPLRPLGNLKYAFRQARHEMRERRAGYATKQAPVYARPKDFHPGNIYRGHREQAAQFRRLKVPNPLPPIKSKCPDPVAAVTQAQLAVLDPSGQRTRLFHPDNPEKVNPGDIILVRLKDSEPVSGTVMSIRRTTPIDTSVLMRNQLTRVSVEVSIKIYSPNVTGIEVVKRTERKARRARLYYLRKPKHDPGSVENTVRSYMRVRAGLGQRRGGKMGTAAAKPQKGQKK